MKIFIFELYYHGNGLYGSEIYGITASSETRAREIIPTRTETTPKVDLKKVYATRSRTEAVDYLGGYYD